jgi:Family of unknown function (DUF5906)
VTTLNHSTYPPLTLVKTDFAPAPARQNPYEHLREAIAQAREAHDGRERVTFCPVHEMGDGRTDHNPSLTVSVNGCGKLKAVCRSRGCEVESSLAGLGLLRVKWRRTASYMYRDENGTLRYTVHREEDGNGGKRFRQQQASGSWSMKGVRPLLYNLPELSAASKGIIRFGFEGEKDSDTATRDGLLSTTISGGANGPMPALECFKLAFPEGGVFVYIADNDPPGRKHAGRMVRAALTVTPLVKLIPSLPHGAKDYSEFREKGGTVEEFKALVEDAPFVTAENLPGDLAVEEDHYETYAEARAAMNGRYAAIEDEFYTLATRKRIDAKRLDQTCTIHYRNEKGSFVPAAPRWRTDPLHRKLAGVAWKPGEPEITAANELNLFTALPGDPAKADGSPFLLLYFLLRDHVLRNPIERAYFEWLIAYRLTHLAAKIPIAIILLGGQGVGKSLLLTTIGKLLFGPYFSMPTAKQLGREFNAVWALKKLVVLCEEAVSGDDAAAKAAWKNLISQVSLIANPKHQAETEQPDYLMFWFTTNYPESIPLDRDDRRAFVVKCVGMLDDCVPGLSAWILNVLFPERADTVEEKQAWRHEQERASNELARYFATIDLKQFSITAPAMETVARREVIRKQRTNLDEKADELVAEARLAQADADDAARESGNEPTPHFSNLITFKQSLLKVDPTDSGRSNPVAWRRALDRAGAVQLVDEKDEEVQVRLDVYEWGTERRIRTTYRPLALINGGFWSKVERSVLTEATARLMVFRGELEYRADAKKLTRRASKY